MPNKDRVKILSEMFIPLWKELLQEFKEFSFNEDDISFKIAVDMKRIQLVFKEKMYQEFFKTFAREKSMVLISGMKKKGIFRFTASHQIIVNARPSLAFSMMQILIILTRDRLKNEKRTRIITTKKRITTTVTKILQENGYSEPELEKRLKMDIFYKKGLYNLKVFLQKKDNTCYRYVDSINEKLNELKEGLIVKIEIK